MKNKLCSDAPPVITESSCNEYSAVDRNDFENLLSREYWDFMKALQASDTELPRIEQLKKL